MRIEVRLDGLGRWFELDGDVLRVEQRAGGWDIAIALPRTTLEFERVVRAEATAARSCEDTPPIILVDNDMLRRSEVSATFRLAGCRVIEVSSPLEVLRALDESQLHPYAIVISGAGEPEIAHLRMHLEQAYPHVPSITLIDRRCFRLGRDLRPPELALGARLHCA